MKRIVFAQLLLIVFTACKNHGKDDVMLPPAPNNSDTSCKAGLIFCSGFEEADWRKTWDDYDGNPEATNKLIENPGPFNITGNHVMRLRVPPGTGAADLVKVLPHTYDTLYARWYQYWEPGYDFSKPNHGSGLFAGNRNYLGQSGIRPTGDDFATAWFEPDASQNGRPFLYAYYRGMYMDCADPNGQYWGDHLPCFIGPGYCSNPAHNAPPSPLPPLLKTGQWYKIQMMLYMGKPVTHAADADGILNFWIDDVEYGPWNNMWFRTTAGLKLNILYLSLFHHAEHSAEGIYIDNVAVSAKPF